MTMTVKTSSRPSSIARESIYLAKSDNGANVPAGPTTGPIPGPELVMQATTALKAVEKSNPVQATSTVRTTNVAIKALINTNTDEIIELLVVRFPILIGTTWFGSVATIIDCFK